MRAKHRTPTPPWSIGIRIISVAIIIACIILLASCGAAVPEEEQNRGREPEWGTGTNLSCEVVG